MAEGGITGKGFVKGDPRINRKGRPKSFDALRQLAQAIAHEEAIAGGVAVVINGHKVTVAEAIMRQWAQSKNPQFQKAFIEIAFGKVPDALDLTSGGKPLQTMDNERFDRTISTLADAIRESLPGAGAEKDGAVDAAE